MVMWAGRTMVLRGKSVSSRAVSWLPCDEIKGESRGWGYFCSCHPNQFMCGRATGPWARVPGYYSLFCTSVSLLPNGDNNICQLKELLQGSNAVAFGLRPGTWNMQLFGSDPYGL